MRIQSPANPKVKALAALKERRERERTGLFLVEGRREVERTLRAGLQLETLLLGPKATPEDQALAGSAPTLELSQEAMERVSVRENPPPVIGVFRLPHKTLKEVQLSQDPLVLVLLGLEKPGNLGAILRSADGAGVDLVLVAEGVDLYSPQVIRNSTGVVFSLPVYPVAEEEAYVQYTPDPAADPLDRPGWGWRGERRYGNGSLGDWAPHIMDVAYWGLKLGAAPRCKIEMLDRLYGGDKLHYKTEVYKWTIPERDDMPELVQYWYSGIRPNTDPEAKDADGNVAASVQNMPPKVVEVMKRYGRRLDEFGTLYVGEKRYLFTGSQGGAGLRFIPEELNRSIPRPPEALPRAKGDNNQEWYHAIRTGEPSTAQFDHSAGFTEHYLSGLLASRVPLGTVVEYDRVNHRVLNLPELNTFITRTYRKGYEVE